MQIHYLRADFQISDQTEGVIWVKQIEDPSAFGVVQLNEKNEIVDFIEKAKGVCFRSGYDWDLLFSKWDRLESGAELFNG